MSIDAQRILDNIQKLDEKVFTLAAKMDEHGSKVDSMYKLFITGNGTPPFQERIRILEKFVNEYTMERDIKKQDSKKFMWVVITLVVPLVVAIIGQLIVFYVKIYPFLVDLDISVIR